MPSKILQETNIQGAQDRLNKINKIPGGKAADFTLLSFKNAIRDIKKFTQPVRNPIKTISSIDPKQMLNRTQALISRIGGLYAEPEIQNPRQVKGPPNSLKINNVEYKPIQVPSDLEPIINNAAKRTNLEPAILKAILMKESDMGTNPRMENIAEIKQSALDQLKKKNIPFDVSTNEGVVNAMADYLKERKTGTTYSGKSFDFTDPVELYMKRYYTRDNAKLDQQIFEFYYNFYKPGR